MVRGGDREFCFDSRRGRRGTGLGRVCSGYRTLRPAAAVSGGWGGGFLRSRYIGVEAGGRRLGGGNQRYMGPEGCCGGIEGGEVRHRER